MSKSATHNQERFELAQADENHTNIANLSYGEEDAKKHTYTVSLEDGDAVSCTCPHYHYRGSFCKHMATVESVLCDCDALGGFPCWNCVHSDKRGVPQ